MSNQATPNSLRIGQSLIMEKGGAIEAMRTFPKRAEIILAATLLTIDLNLSRDEIRRVILDMAGELDRIEFRQGWFHQRKTGFK